MLNLDKKLTLLYLGSILIAVGIYIVCQFVCPIHEAPLSAMDGFKDVKYMAEVLTCLLAVGFCYLSTRLITLRKVQKEIATNPNKYAKWAILRWLMLAIVIFSGIGVHYLFLSPSTIGCPIIGVLFMFFVWPTKVRREHETQMAILAQSKK